MNRIVKILFFLISTSLISSCNAENNGRVKVLLSTNYGDITVELYNETPLHRDNFVKLVNEDFFEGVLFHRVIKNFMIQAGDPKSIGAEPGARLGNGGLGYTIEAEFNDAFFHKKGALAAARQGDRSNPEKRSSGSQFYIVQGEIFTTWKMDTLEMKMNSGLLQSIQKDYFSKAQDELKKYRNEGKQEEFNLRVAEIREKSDSAYQVAPKKTIPEERKQIYSTIGGYPSLDGAYTVFGEVVKGLEIIDKIGAVETDKSNRPTTDVIIKKAEIIK